MPFTDLNIDFPMRDLTAQAQVRTGKITGPASYPTGGEAVDLLEDLGLSQVWWWAPMVFTNGTAVILAIYDVVTSKVKYFDMAGAEIADATDLSAYTSTFFATGK